MIIDPGIYYIEEVWSSISGVLHIPQSEAEYDRLVSVLNYLIDQIGSDETHPLASLMDVIGLLIESFEKGNPDLDWEMHD